MTCDQTGPTPPTRRAAGLALAALGALTMLAGCRTPPAPSAAAYFPLEPGATRTYRIVVTATDELDEVDEPLAMTVETVGPDERAGGAGITRQQVDRDGATYQLFLGVDENGVFHHATQAPGETAPVVAKEHFYFVRNPIRVGSSWPGRSAPSFLDVMGFFGPVDVVSTITAVGETVRTPAGEFRDTVRIETKGSAQVGDADAGSETESEDDDWDLYRGTFSVAETIWLARDVGMVKSIFVEHFKGDFEERSTTATTELQTFTQGAR